MNSIVSFEEYYCLECSIFYTSPEVMNKWTCPKCSSYLKIKVDINNYFYECLRVPPTELRKGEQVTLDNLHIYSILNIEKTGIQYRIALKGYRVVNFDKDDQITMIDGGWFHN